MRAEVWWISVCRGTSEGRGKPAPEGFCSVMELNPICKGFSAHKRETDVAHCWLQKGARATLNIQLNYLPTRLFQLCECELGVVGAVRLIRIRGRNLLVAEWSLLSFRLFVSTYSNGFYYCAVCMFLCSYGLRPLLEDGWWIIHQV